MDYGINKNEYIFFISSYCIFIDELTPTEIEEPAIIDRQGIYFINIIVVFFTTYFMFKYGLGNY